MHVSIFSKYKWGARRPRRPSLGPPVPDKSSMTCFCGNDNDKSKSKRYCKQHQKAFDNIPDKSSTTCFCGNDKSKSKRYCKQHQKAFDNTRNDVMKNYDEKNYAIVAQLLMEQAERRGLIDSPQRRVEAPESPSKSPDSLTAGPANRSPAAQEEGHVEERPHLERDRGEEGVHVRGPEGRGWCILRRSGAQEARN